MSESLNEMRASIKKFVKSHIFDKDDYGNFIYMNSLSEKNFNKLDLLVKKEKNKIKNIEDLSNALLIHYGCVIYEDGENQSKIKTIYSYFKEVNYWIKNYNNTYDCISEDILVLKNKSEIFYDLYSHDLPLNIKKFLLKEGKRSINCLESIIAESEQNDLIKEIYFMHNYVERGFDLALNRTICDDLYKDNLSFIDDLIDCKNLLESNEFRINLYYIKECLLILRNRDLKIIEKYKYKNRSEFINDFIQTISVAKSFIENKINADTMITEDVKKEIIEDQKDFFIDVKNVKNLLVIEAPYYLESDTSIPYLPKSLFRIDEKINKINCYIDTLKNLSSENKYLLQIQEQVAQTLLFGIENLSISEKENLVSGIDKVIDCYEIMLKKNYGFEKENKDLFTKKIFQIKQLKEQIVYLKIESSIHNYV